VALPVAGATPRRSAKMKTPTKSASYLVAFGATILLASCDGKQEAFSEYNQGYNEGVRETQEASERPQGPGIITPGKGFARIELGDPKDKLLKTLGEPTNIFIKEPPKIGPGDYYLTFGHSGVEFLMEDDRVLSIFFNYKTKKQSIFIGATDKGIGSKSSIDDVISKYGKPDRIGKSTVSEFEEYPGVEETRINYNEFGIQFVFWNSEISQIVITKQAK